MSCQRAKQHASVDEGQVWALVDFSNYQASKEQKSIGCNVSPYGITL